MQLVDLLGQAETIRFHIYDGRSQQASSLLGDMRERFKIHESPSLVGYTQLAEGLLLQQSGDWFQAIDRFRRAEILSRVARRRDLAGLANAWISHCEFNLGHYEDSARRIVELSTDFSDGGDEFRHRYCLAAAQLFAFAGEWSTARVWFDRARALAGLIGSKGLFSATIFNHFAMRIWNSLLLSRVSLGAMTADIQGEIESLSSALNYDSLAGVTNRPALHSLLHSQAIGAAGRHDQAIVVLERLLDDSSGLGSTDVWRARLEYAWNAAASGHLDIHRNELRKMLSSCFEHLVDDDELSLAHSIHAAISRIDGNEDLYSLHVEASEYYRARLQSRRVETAGILKSVLLSGAGL